MTQDMGVMAHPEVYIFISIHIPNLGTPALCYEERIGWKVMDIMGYASWHHLFGTLEKFFRKRCFFSIQVKKMVHSRNLRKLKDVIA
jgi:hypothetical protein